MNEKKSFLSVKEMVEMALLISLAVVLDLDGLKISLGANGGSIGFTMLPLIILAFRHGFIKSVIGIGIIYGIVTNLLDGWGLVYYPFDYFVAYGLSIPLVGLFSRYIFNKRASKDNLLINYGFILLSVLLAGVIRVIGHTISSIVFYEYTLGAALAYNIAYVGPSILICLAILFILYPSLLVINKKFPTDFLKKIND